MQSIVQRNALTNRPYAMPRRLVRGLFAWLSALFMLGSAAAVATAQSDKPAMIIMDMSQSMWGRVDGDITKYEAARDVMVQNIDRWQEGAKLGMISYGHRRSGDCNDIEVVFNPGQANGQNMQAWFDSVRPRGKTPLTAAIRQAADTVTAQGGNKLIVITDGIESCGQDPCSLANEFDAKGQNLSIDIVGFDLNKNDQDLISCIASNSGGQFLAADNADQLYEVLNRVNEEAISQLTESMRFQQEAFDRILLQCEQEKDTLRAALSDRDAQLASQRTMLGDLRAQTSELASRNQSLARDVERCQSDKAELEADLAVLRDELDQNKIELASVQSRSSQQISDLSNQLAGANRALQTLETENQGLLARLSDAQGQGESAQDQNSRLTNQLDQLRRELAAVNTEKAALAVNNANLNAALGVSDAKNQDLQTALNTLRAQTDALGVQNDTQASDLAALRQQYDQLSSKYDADVLDLQRRLEQTQENYDRDTAAFENQIAALRDQGEKLEFDLAQLRDNLARQQSTNQRLTNQLSALRAENNAANAQLQDTLKQNADQSTRIDSLTRQSSALTSQLAATEARLEGVAQELERAVRANEDLVLELAKSASQNRRLDDSLNKALAGIADLETQLARSQDQEALLAQQLASTENQRDDLGTRLANANSRIADLENQISQLSGSNKVLNAQLSAALAEKNQLSEDLGSATSQIANLTDDLANARLAIDRLNLAVGDAEFAAAKLSDELDFANQQGAGLRRDLQAQLSRNEQLASELAAISVQLARTGAERQSFADLNEQLLSRLRGALSELQVFNSAVADISSGVDMLSGIVDIDSDNLRGAADSVVLEIAPGIAAPRELSSWEVYDAQGALLREGVGTRFSLPTPIATYTVVAKIGGYQTETQIAVDQFKVIEHGLVVDLGILSIALANQLGSQAATDLPISELVVFKDGEPIYGQVLTGQALVALEPGDYVVKIDTNGQVTQLATSIAAGKQRDLMAEIPVRDTTLEFQTSTGRSVIEGEVNWVIYQAAKFGTSPEHSGTQGKAIFPLAVGDYIIQYGAGGVQQTQAFSVTAVGQSALIISLGS